MELYKGGQVPLAEFAEMKPDGDIMTALLIKKTGMNMAYEMMRNEAVDFPVLSAAAAEDGAGNTRIAVGARPSRAGLVTWEGQLSALDAKERQEQAARLADTFNYGSNMRGSAEYRRYLAGVLLDRAAARIAAQKMNREEKTR